MYGLSGVLSICSGIATGKSLNQLDLAEFPNMPFLYWLAVAGALVKPKWTDQKNWPALKVIELPSSTVIVGNSQASESRSTDAPRPAAMQLITMNVTWMAAAHFQHLFNQQCLDECRDCY
jgi:hypothetical protein